MRILFFITLLAVSYSVTAQQLFPVPDLVKQAFDKQYPEAKDLKWTGGLDNHTVKFSMNEKQMKAVYTKDGIWVSTEVQSKMEELPKVVQEGFSSCKYKDWPVKEVIEVTKPRIEAVEYKIIVQKSMITKKLLVFDAKGRLYEELLSL
ncbi:MAG: PepSY-like domain-containing protein [Lacibacter sp.]